MPILYNFRLNEAHQLPLLNAVYVCRFVTRFGTLPTYINMDGGEACEIGSVPMPNATWLIAAVADFHESYGATHPYIAVFLCIAGKNFKFCLKAVSLQANNLRLVAPSSFNDKEKFIRIFHVYQEPLPNDQQCNTLCDVLECD